MNNIYSIDIYCLQYMFSVKKTGGKELRVLCLMCVDCVIRNVDR